MKKRRYDDDEILKDGEKLHVSMFAMDGMDPLQQAIANDGLRVTDGAGGTQGLNRPGFRLAAADVDRRTTAADALDAAYTDYHEDLVNAWCGGDARTKRTHHYDPKGRLRGYSETEIEENKRDDDKKDKKAQDHHQQMDAAYSAYNAELREAWRRS